jgi:hypothetical protein
VHTGPNTEYALPLSLPLTRYEGESDAILIDKTGLTGNYDFMLQCSQRLSWALLTEWRATMDSLSCGVYPGYCGAFGGQCASWLASQDQ